MPPKLISKACESRIPRSGEDGEKVNCYVVALDREGSPFFVATGYADQTLTGLKWNGHSYADEYCLGLPELENGKLRVTHYYGLSEVKYDNIYDIVWHYIIKLVYLRIHLYRHVSSAHQYFFNKQKLITKKRMELLQFMMDDQLDRTHDGISSLDLMTKLYSISWVLHPSGDEQQKKLELYLDSLVASEELRKVNDQYVVTGKAINTIEKYEEEDRRHTEAVKLQKKMVFLTIILAFVAIVQSGLIKLPTLLGLSNNDSVESTHNKQIQPTQKRAADLDVSRQEYLMNITQFFETTILDRDTGASGRYIVLPRRAFASPAVLPSTQPVSGDDGRHVFLELVKWVAESEPQLIDPGALVRAVATCLAVDVSTAYATDVSGRIARFARRGLPEPSQVR